MKRFFRWTACLLTVCFLAGLLPPVGFAAGTVHNVADGGELLTAIGNANNGDTISLSGSVMVGTSESGGGAPWIIDKAITISGGEITLRTGGILLDADVVFDGVKLAFISSERNAIIANGHTLTLNNVQNSGTFSFNLFCGGLVEAGYVGGVAGVGYRASGDRGEIKIEGQTSLQGASNVAGSGNIYAGNLALGSGTPAGTFSGTAEIRTSGAAANSRLGTIYACGAQQSQNASGNNVTTADKQSGANGGIQIYPGVYGVTAVECYDQASVTFQGNYGNPSSVPLIRPKNLTLNAGDYASPVGSDLDGVKICSINSILDLSALGGNVTADSFVAEKENFLVLGQDQTLTVSGSAKTTVGDPVKVAIGGLSGSRENSNAVPEDGHTYISTPSGTDEKLFSLLPHSNYPDGTLKMDNGGNWIALNGDSAMGNVQVRSLTLADKAVENSVFYAEMPLNVQYVRGNSLAAVALEISVNGIPTAPDDEGNYTVTVDGTELLLYVSDEDGAEFLNVGPADVWSALPSDTAYTITVTIPTENSATNRPLSATATLTVGTASPVTPVKIDKPTGASGLIYNQIPQTGVEAGLGYTLSGTAQAADAGDYTATATLEPGYQWSDGTTASCQITWSIAKADQDAPSGLQGTAPSGANLNDGQITGVESHMEYATQPDFSDAKNCTGTEISDLAAGTYYVRCMGSKNYNPSPAAAVIVPAYGAPPDTVTSIRVNSTEHKTAYTVGESLDVTGLTIAAVKADHTQETIAVTAEMVSSFDSSAAGTLTLTITYEGCTTTLTVTVSPAQGGGDSGDPGTTEPAKRYLVTVNGGTGGGTYAEGASVTITATVPSGKEFAGWTITPNVTFTNGGLHSAAVTFTMPDGAVTAAAAFKNKNNSNSGGGGGGSYTPTYPPTVEKPSEGGTITITPSRPNAGNRVTIQPKPDSGYEVDKITVTDQNGKPVTVTQNTDGSYTFTQPNGIVKVEVSYKPIETAPVETPWQNPFTDVPEDAWYSDAVRYASENGLMNGYSNGAFGPDDHLSRAQLAQILFSREDRPVVTYLMQFSDVPGEVWYTEAVHWAASQGIVGGYGDGRFGPDDNITREQLAVMLWRYAGSPVATKKELHFNDTDKISHYALDAMLWAVENGIINGYGNGQLGPNGLATRAQTVQILYNYLSVR